MDQIKKAKPGCVNGRIDPSTTTKFRLFSSTGGFCQNPVCQTELFKHVDDDVIHIGEIAHVIAANDQGPRSSPDISSEERGRYENLIILCPTCHTTIDKAPKSYPSALLHKWKDSHEQKIIGLFECLKLNTRSEVKALIGPILLANRTIFELYGPMNEERFNPESSSPIIWRRKIRSSIIPNNRKILMMCETNRHLMSNIEMQYLEKFRQHVDDFEAKHLFGFKINGSLFPNAMNELFD